MANGIADIFYNPRGGLRSYRTGFVDRPMQVRSDMRQPNYLSRPRFVDGRLVGPDQIRALGSGMSGPDALTRGGISSLPSAGSPQPLSRMQSMGNAIGNMFAGAAADPRNPFVSTSPVNRRPISAAPSMNANANRDRATMQNMTNVDLGRVSSEVKQGSANLGNQIMSLVSDTYASVTGKLPTAAEMQAITKRAIDKFSQVDTRLRQTSAQVTNTAVAAVRSAIGELMPSGAQAQTQRGATTPRMGMDPVTEDDNMPNRRGMSDYQIRGMLNQAMPQEQRGGGITSLERRAMGPGMQSPTQRPPRVFMEDGSEIGAGGGRLPEPVMAVPTASAAPTTSAEARADASMMSSVEGAVPDALARPLPKDATDSELNAGIDETFDNRAPAEKTENDFANMTLVELGLNMMASDKPTVLGMLGDAGQKTIAARTVREEKRADREFKERMATIERDFRRDEGDKNRALQKEKIDNAYETRKEEARIASEKLGIDSKLVDARIKALDAEQDIAKKMFGLKDRELTSKDIRADQSLYQTLFKSTSDLVIAANKNNYDLNQMKPSDAAGKLSQLVMDRLKATVGSTSAGRAFNSPAFKAFVFEEAGKKFFGGRGGGKIAGSYSADGGLTMVK